ncbi:hypothetical protein SERLA73DRAFT_176515 [Serpula lacrymans var. lacrymans S7.3]|uniref:DUF7729 domain-containing protein n=2 Tax=Serpula lacrymans var. lacrymans TaxID=341189 RepID=F8PN37_SERL3|nr:uncharacterized protein SERLADRAFT_459399 [Serpula lacrymans var. lacrymans S7.9]EGO03019.1 hypothetical protein SERLA73DRAFT_176515 [Serpula lacrymans var. lacrymans S7.3]EGO28697.1 hypothetical protein SERLADRAFT_459399 [Serpula lacrymans var. lacrymans S7.9]
MKSIAVLSVLVSAVVAQSSSSNTTANPLIPTDISQGCSSFLNSLNSNSNLTACTSPIVSATSAFGPGANSSSPSSSDVNSALSSLCASSAFTNCPDSIIGGQLSAFYSACSAELTSSPNDDVIRIYDTLYVLTPLRQAVCSKGDNGQYCVTQVTNGMNSSSTGVGSVDIVIPGSDQAKVSNLYYTPQVLSRRDDSNTTAALIPNTTTYHDTNLVFLFLQPSMSSSSLCTACTRSILTPYITFESNRPYAPGLSTSPLMSGQTALVSAIQSQCGTNFLSGAVQAAGGISSGILSGAASRSLSQDLNGPVSIFLGMAALAVASL